MRRSTWTLTRRTAIALAAGAVLAGCGSGKSPIGPILGARHPAPARKPVARAPTVPTDMVAAVGDAKPGAARVTVRFDLRARPRVSQPLDVDMVILPSAGVDRVYGKVEADEGLELVNGAQIAPADRPAEDVPIPHSMRVVPQREGVLTLRAVVSTDSGGQSSSQTFSSPLIAGLGADAQASSADAATAPARNR